MNWPDCQKQIYHYPNAIYKKFSTKEEAENFLAGVSASSPKDLNVEYQIYVDGSYADGLYSWAFVVYKNDALYYTKNGQGTSVDAARLRNVAGEITAAREAILWAEAQGAEKIALYYDYNGIACWADGSWKANLPETRQYADFMKKRLVNVHFCKVQGHSGNAGNELADKLAKEALGIR